MRVFMEDIGQEVELREPPEGFRKIVEIPIGEIPVRYITHESRFLIQCLTHTSEGLFLPLNTYEMDRNDCASDTLHY